MGKGGGQGRGGGGNSAGESNRKVAHKKVDQKGDGERAHKHGILMLTDPFQCVTDDERKWATVRLPAASLR